ncbi:MAG: hypothetical protein AMXMBFR82_06950 [Candidatus Hydrogenedentota bacterium]
MLLNNTEFWLLEHIERNQTVPKELCNLARKLASLGLLCLGYHRDGTKVKETGSLTFLGRQIVRLERIERSPFRCALQSFFAPFI